MWLAALIDRHRAHDGDRIAMVDDDRAVTYAELGRRVEGLAAALRAEGVRRGDRVLMLSRNRVEALEAYFALTRVGAVIVPINHGLVRAEVDHVVELTAAVGAIGEAELIERSVDTSALRFTWPFEGEEHQAATTSGATFSPDPALALDDPAAILCTSATTGLPKGVVLTHRAFQHQALSWLATTQAGQDVVYFAAPPVFHSTVMCALAYLAGGSTVVLTRNFTPQRCLEVIERHRVTHAYLVPSMIGYVLRARGLRDADMSSLQEVFHGAAPMTLELRRSAAEALGCALRDCYGQAEAGGPVTLGEPLRATATDEARWQSAGRPLLGFDLAIVDGEGLPVPAGEAGEVCVRSPSTMRGYWHNDEATARAMRHGWLRTGDTGFLGADGELTIIDRITDMIIRGGQNVYPAEIERVLCQHPAVSEAAVVGMPDEALGEAPVAYVVCEDGVSVADLTRFCAERLAPYKRPKLIEPVDEIPRNPAGKILKRVLREREPAV